MMKAIHSVILAGILAIVASSVVFAGGLEELKVSYSAMPLNAPSIVSAKLDMVDKAFKDEGIDIKYATFTAGPQMTEAFAARGLDIASVMGATSAISARAAGVDIKIVAAYSTNPQGFALVVPMDSSIRDISDLKGRMVGGPKGTAAHQLLARILSGEKGIMMKDVEFANMQVPDVAAALVARQIDAGLLVEPHLTKLVDAKKVRVLRDGTGLIGGLTVIVARGDLVRDNRPIVKRFLRAHAQAVRFVATNPTETIAAVADETKLTKEQVRKLLPRYDFDPALRPSVIEELRDCIDFMLEAGMIKRRVDIGDLVTQGLL